jgi:transposase
VIRTQEEHLAHYGILRRSGRYPWGSGNQSQRNRSFLDTVDKLKKEGMSEAQIASGFGITTTDLRAAKSIALAQQRQERIIQTERLKAKGLSNSAIARVQGRNESSVRADLVPGAKNKADALQTTASMLKDQVAKKKYIQIGSGVENQLGITQSHLNTSVAILKEEGYTVHTIKVQQLGTGKFTTVKVLAPPGTTRSEVQRNRAEIQLITDYSQDHGRTFFSTQSPISVSSRRIAVNYAEDGGAKADGVIYVRPGVKDLSIGANRYGQVRIAVDGTHYLKGMAVYKDDLPEGVDLVFNTNKSRTNNKKDVMKEMSDDPDNPFGTIVRQVHGPDGKVTSAMNLVGSPTKEGSGEEGSWDQWSRNLPSQMLSKQDPTLAKQQLDLTYERRLREFNEINSLTNPTVRKKLLLGFSDQTDSAAAHLQAANLPRQATKVLLPVPSMKDTEIYAPTMRDGERVVLVRFPHGGKFEIPELTVNNRNRDARKLLGTSAKDAVGINHNVAKRLSGADFDGDTVLVIPNNKGLVKNAPALKDLQGFDPQSYKIPDDSPIPRITPSRKQQEMGNVSNLITDMTLRGADAPELARAVKHSMVVIDSEKHGLNWKQSEIDNGIPALKQKYQDGKRAGAATLISRAGAEKRIPERKTGYKIDPETGRKIYTETGRMIPERKRTVDPVSGKVTYVSTGRTVPVKIVTTKLADTEDAFTLVSKSPTPMEVIYAEHSNRLKAMANTARKEAVSTKNTPYSPSARKVYENERSTLLAKLNLAEKNAPLEKQAQILANAQVGLRRQANPGMSDDEVKKIQQIALNEARNRTGAKKTQIVITQNEWNAIQAGAISTNKLTKILNNADLDNVRQLAMPKHKPKMSSTMKRRAQSMLDAGYTQAEVADQLGVGLTTLKIGLNGE